jgi:hypothetical protein
MRFTAAQKVIATSAAALGVVLGAAGITAAATNSGTTPAQQQHGADNGTGDYTPANEQGKPEPADHETEAAENPDASEHRGSDQQDPAGSDGEEAPAVTTSGPGGQG